MIDYAHQPTRSTRSHEKGINDMATLTPKEIAQRFDTDARTLRKFLRHEAKVNSTETPGKGSRWAIESKSVRSLQRRFNAWNAARTPQSTESTDEVETPDAG